MSMRLQPDKDAFKACYGAWLDQVAVLVRSSEIGTTFGLLGPWGSGKSSACAALVRLIHGLNKTESGLSFQCVTIDTFKLRSLSKFEQDKEIYDQLSSDILLKDEVFDWGKKRKKVYEALKIISPALSIFGTPGTGDLIAKLADQAIKEVDKGTSSQDLPESPDVDRVVIILDDLDRCEPKEAMTILGNISSQSFIDKTNIIVACDPDVLAAHISSACGIPKHSGRDVLSKYLHVPIRIPMGESKEHRTVLSRRLNDIKCNDKLKNAVLTHHAALPIREILSAIPQADLWCKILDSCPNSVKTDTDASILLWLSAVSNICPFITRTAINGRKWRELTNIINQQHFNAHTAQFSDIFGSEALNIIQARVDILRFGKSVFGQLDEPSTLKIEGMVIGISTYA